MNKPIITNSAHYRQIIELRNGLVTAFGEYDSLPDYVLLTVQTLDKGLNEWMEEQDKREHAREEMEEYMQSMNIKSDVASWRQEKKERGTE